MSRPGYAPSVAPVKSLTFDLLCGAALTTFAAHTVKKLAPCNMKVIGIFLNVGGRGGTHVTSTVDVLKTSTSLLAALFDVAALTPATPVNKEGSALAAAADSIAKDTVISVVAAEASGTSPTWQDVTVQIDYVEIVI